MLNRSVCKKCMNRFYTSVKWNDVDESLWSQGVVRCVALIDVPGDEPLPRISINKINHACTNKFEHAVFTGMNHEAL